MSKYLANRLNTVFPNFTHNDVEYDTPIKGTVYSVGSIVKEEIKK